MVCGSPWLAQRRVCAFATAVSSAAATQAASEKRFTAFPTPALGSGRRADPRYLKRDCVTVSSSLGSELRYDAMALISGCVNGRAMPIMIGLLRPTSGL